MKKKKLSITLKEIDEKQEQLKLKEVELEKLIANQQEYSDGLKQLKREIEADKERFKLESLSHGSCLYDFKTFKILKIINPKTDAHFKRTNVTFATGSGELVDTVCVRAYSLRKHGVFIAIEMEQYSVGLYNNTFASCEVIDQSIYENIENQYKLRNAGIETIVTSLQKANLPFTNGADFIRFAHSELIRIHDMGLRIVTVTYEGQKIGR